MKNAVMILVFGIMLLGATGATGEEIVLYPHEDVYTSSENPNDNYGGSTDLYLGKGTYWGLGFWRNYLMFDLSDVSGTVTSASLHLYQYDHGPAAGGLPCDLHRVTGPWSEYTVTWNTHPSHAGTIYDSRDVGGTNGWIVWNATALVTDWTEGGYPNEGLMLKHYYEITAGASRYGIIYATEDSHTDLRPKLVIETAAEGCWLNCPAGDGGLLNMEGVGNKSPDIDGSGMVDIVDFALFATEYGGIDYCTDFNCDGIVDIVDFALFATHFQHGPGPDGICE